MASITVSDEQIRYAAIGVGRDWIALKQYLTTVLPVPAVYSNVGAHVLIQQGGPDIVNGKEDPSRPWTVGAPTNVVQQYPGYAGSQG